MCSFYIMCSYNIMNAASTDSIQRYEGNKACLSPVIVSHPVYWDTFIWLIFFKGMDVSFTAFDCLLSLSHVDNSTMCEITVFFTVFFICAAELVFGSLLAVCVIL